VAVIDGVFCLDARVIYKRETLSVYCIQGGYTLNRIKLRRFENRYMSAKNAAMAHFAVGKVTHRLQPLSLSVTAHCKVVNNAGVTWVITSPDFDR